MERIALFKRPLKSFGKMKKKKMFRMYEIFVVFSVVLIFLLFLLDGWLKGKLELNYQDSSSY